MSLHFTCEYRGNGRGNGQMAHQTSLWVWKAMAFESMSIIYKGGSLRRILGEPQMRSRVSVGVEKSLDERQVLCQRRRCVTTI